MAGPARLKAAGRPDTMDSAQAKSASKAMSEKQTEEEKKGLEILKDAGAIIQPAPAATDEQGQAIQAWADALPESFAAVYMGSRGFVTPEGQPDLAFLGRWRVGYASEWPTTRKGPDGKEEVYMRKVEAVTIPTAGGAVFVRTCCGKDKLAQKGVTRRLFNEAALYQKEKPVVIVEGEIDALSILYSAGDIVEAVGLGGYQNWKNVLRLVKSGEVKARRFIIALDNDPPEKEDTRAKVRNAAVSLRLGLNAADRVAIIADAVYGVNGEGYKDANETLVKEPARLRREIELAAALAMSIDDPWEKKREAYEQENSALAGLEVFTREGEETEKPAKTGLEGLDDLLDGGLYEGLYTLFSTPGAGKTTLVLQIADAIAKAGRDVLFIALEMSKQALQARSLSRLSFLLADGDKSYTALTERQLSTGKWKQLGRTEWNRAARTIYEALRTYKRWADRVYIMEAQGGSFEAVREAVQRHILFRGCPPVVIVDYLQILRPGNTGLTDKQAVDSHVLGLKQLSRDCHLPVVVVSSLGRTSYEGRLTLSSGKESGGIEYTADVVLGMQLLGVGLPGFNEEEAKEKETRQLEIVALKNRTGALGSAFVNYWPAWNVMMDAPELKAELAEMRKEAKEAKAAKKSK